MKEREEREYESALHYITGFFSYTLFHAHTHGSMLHTYECICSQKALNNNYNMDKHKKKKKLESLCKNDRQEICVFKV